MDVIHERAVGMDISKREAKVCVRITGKRKGTFESSVGGGGKGWPGPGRDCRD